MSKRLCGFSEGSAYDDPHLLFARAFKQALEHRLRSATKTGAEFARKRQLLVFDRFLARMVATLGDAATLKGGLVLELRLERARTTKDVDLRLMGFQGDILARLQEAGRQDLGDFIHIHALVTDGGCRSDGTFVPSARQEARG